MSKFVVYACKDSKRATGQFTLWGKMQYKANGVLLTSALFWLRSLEPKDKWAEIEIPDNHKLVTEVVGDREFTHIELL